MESAQKSHRSRRDQSSLKAASATDLGSDFRPAAESEATRRSIAFGLERLGLIPFRAPAATMLAALALAGLAIPGIQRIKTDDSLSQLFRSEDPSFKQFEQISREFPSSEYDVLVVISGQSLLARVRERKLQNSTSLATSKLRAIRSRDTGRRLLETCLGM
ncbi:MAG TPA: hypothetical protein VMB83_08375 [Roseiarcus sp.]|nr:hypothetical protein [Roseiarcus sp.]